MKHRDRVIKNLKDLLRYLSSDIKPEMGPTWFRGHAVKEWDLVPSIVHTKSKKKEIDYLKEFKQHAMLLVEPRRPQNNIEWLFVMRHYHIPTRLLDWTESPLVATYFALDDEKFYNKDAALWMFLPLEWNMEVTKIRDNTTLPSFEEDEEIMFPYDPLEFAKPNSERNPQKPIAFLAPRNTHRMQVQYSVFTINHHDNTSFQKINNGKHVWRYVIPARIKKTLKKELELLQMNKFQLFPELSNIQDKIKDVK